MSSQLSAYIFLGFFGAAVVSLALYIIFNYRQNVKNKKVTLPEFDDLQVEGEEPEIVTDNDDSWHLQSLDDDTTIDQSFKKSTKEDFDINDLKFRVNFTNEEAASNKLVLPDLDQPLNDSVSSEYRPRRSE